MERRNLPQRPRGRERERGERSETFKGCLILSWPDPELRAFCERPDRQIGPLRSYASPAEGVEVVTLNSVRASTVGAVWSNAAPESERTTLMPSSRISVPKFWPPDNFDS